MWAPKTTAINSTLIINVPELVSPSQVFPILDSSRSRRIRCDLWHYKTSSPLTCPSGRCQLKMTNPTSQYDRYNISAFEGQTEIPYDYASLPLLPSFLAPPLPFPKPGVSDTCNIPVAGVSGRNQRQDLSLLTLSMACPLFLWNFYYRTAIGPIRSARSPHTRTPDGFTPGCFNPYLTHTHVHTHTCAHTSLTLTTHTNTTCLFHLGA